MVRLTDNPDMTIAVYRGRKATPNKDLKAPLLYQHEKCYREFSLQASRIRVKEVFFRHLKAKMSTINQLSINSTKFDVIRKREQNQNMQGEHS